MKAITANHLTGGHAVFYSGENGWSRDIVGAELFSDKEALVAALALAAKDEKSGDIIGAYEIDVNVEDGRPVPVKLRERLRVEGPSVAYGAEMKLEGFYAA